jgi:hypothetical protein
LFDEAMAMPAGEARDAKLAESLYCVDMALHLDPSMIDALLLKQEITGEQVYIYHDAITHRVFDEMLDDEMSAMDLPELPEAEVAADTPDAPAEQPAEQEPVADAASDQAWLDEMLDESFEQADAAAEEDAVADAAETQDVIDQAFSPYAKFFGFSWRSMTTAELLEMAARAAEEDGQAPEDGATTGVDTGDQWEDAAWEEFYFDGDE